MKTIAEAREAYDEQAWRHAEGMGDEEAYRVAWFDLWMAIHNAKGIDRVPPLGPERMVTRR